MKNQTFLVLLSFATVVGFQNCSPQKATAASQELAALDQGADQKLDAPPVQVTEANEYKNPETQSVSKRVVPKRIEFDYAYDFRMSPSAQLNKSRFKYSLEIATGAIMDLQSGSKVWQLTGVQIRQLKILLSGTKVASPEDGRLCPALWGPPYALLVSPSGNFELGAGAPGCAQDLVKILTGKNAGLRKFLDNIEPGGTVASVK
jgi:hypothetical protein